MSKFIKRQKRKLRIRKNISGSALKPRVTVFRSNRFFYAQAIDDSDGKTLCAIRSEVNPTVGDVRSLGEKFGGEINKLKLKTVVFDRNGYNYHGAVAAFAEGMRTANIKL